MRSRLAAARASSRASIDTHQKHLPEILKRAHAHKGASFVEIFQNCIVYNDGVFANFTDEDVAADTQVHVEHGKPLIFGKDNAQGHPPQYRHVRARGRDSRARTA